MQVIIYYEHETENFTFLDLKPKTSEDKMYFVFSPDEGENFPLKDIFISSDLLFQLLKEYALMQTSLTELGIETETINTIIEDYVEPEEVTLNDEI